MTRILSITLDIFAATIVLIPVMFFLWKIYFRDLKKTLLYTIFCVYLIAVYALVGLPCITRFKMVAVFNFIPFVDMMSDKANSIYNILLFIPLGVLLPILSDKFKTIKNTFLFGLSMTLIIELLQLFTFRATDVNDIITNMLGTILGYLISKLAIRKFPQSADEYRKRYYDVYILCGITFLIMFFIQPFIMNWLYSVMY